MSSTNSPQMQRSFSMPVQPQPLPTRTMKRSQEKETLYEEDYYPESPSCERRNKSRVDNRDRLGSHSLSDNNITTADWAGSTIELNTDLRRNEIDAFCHRRKPYRVVEKSGRENVIFKRIPDKSWRYIRDFVTTLVRFLLPKRFLMNSKTSSSTPNLTTILPGTVNTSSAHNHEVSSSFQRDAEEEKEELTNNEIQLLDDETTNDKSEVNDISRVDSQPRSDRCQKEDRHVKFSLYD